MRKGENQITELLYLAGNLFRIYLIYLFFKLFFAAEGSKLRLRIRYALFILYFAGNSLGYLYFQWSPVVILLSNLMGLFLVVLTYEGKWKYKICAPVMILVFNLICEDLVYIAVVTAKVKHVVPVAMAVSDLLCFLIIVLLQRFLELRKGEDIFFRDWLRVVSVPVISMAIIVITVDNCEDETAVAIGEFGFLILNILCFYLFQHLTKLHRNQTQVMVLEVQNRAYQQQLELLNQARENISALRHDWNNHVAGLQHLAEQEDLSALKNYLGEMKNAVNVQGEFVSTGNTLIDGILNLKLGEAEKLQTTIHCSVKLQNNRSTEEMDINILLGNLLDNALQALRQCRGVRELFFTMEERRGMLHIRIRNSHSGSIRKRGEYFVTTKADSHKHGIGLKNVRRIVEKYHGELQFDYDERWFSVEILLFSK